jgi:hypothetical protein
MRGTRAKELRKVVYGDMSLRSGRETKIFRTIKRFFTGKMNELGERETEKINRDTTVCVGPRRAYQDLKKRYRQLSVRNGNVCLRSENIMEER